ncbi:MAG: hypothetical protein KDB55_14855 [Mycobacterium sp.]|nr:hypothetical protein [Mycobacterium sp.]MCB0943818.1 hypothetical protein [Mycobacterium sp.]
MTEAAIFDTYRRMLLFPATWDTNNGRHSFISDHAGRSGGSSSTTTSSMSGTTADCFDG